MKLIQSGESAHKRLESYKFLSMKAAVLHIRSVYATTQYLEYRVRKALVLHEKICGGLHMAATGHLNLRPTHSMLFEAVAQRTVLKFSVSRASK